MWVVNKLCLHLECFMHGEVWGSIRPLWKTLTDTQTYPEVSRVTLIQLNW